MVEMIRLSDLVITWHCMLFCCLAIVRAVVVSVGICQAGEYNGHHGNTMQRCVGISPSQPSE